MSNFLYNTEIEQNHKLYGKFIAPIKAFIEDESDAMEKSKTALDVLFNIEKSDRFAETIASDGDFDTFRAKKEGQRAENLKFDGGYTKMIEHIEYGGEFTITKKMAADSKLGIAANIQREPRKFVRAYYKTRVKVATEALIRATVSSAKILGEDVDLTTGDKKPLFSSEHTFSSDKMKGKKGTNYFYGDFTKDTATFEKVLNLLANKMRNFSNEQGDPMEYVPDTIIIPGNRPELEAIAKKVVGTERETGGNNNDINLQMGNWTLVVLSNWVTEDDRFMLMSSAANKQLDGNMFYNREPLDIMNWIDGHSRNLIYNGYCRFGVGFGTWKHILLGVSSASEVKGATKIEIA